MILAQRELLTLATSEVTVGRLEIERLKLMLAKARREQYGQSSERGRLLVEQLELAIEDLEEAQAEQETEAEIAAPAAAREKRANNPRPLRRPLPDCVFRKIRDSDFGNSRTGISVIPGQGFR